ncbi:conserved hypothetical protein [Uncinocarpus reesii 1704]|uniref:60S ribosomal protein L20 n=1 Tax=Uncinocarpus reesii (strain UAMH 1704) TaxID=336963 RepID=C4JWP1_UNCRE|nr:uncharacterized protein UREG_06983 [Uncinocarpus reesii 1704]EEP82118.1 conserved hypothetical protein [Uncinocarpus reesii 1704]
MTSPVIIPRRPVLNLPFLLPFCSESTSLLVQRNQSTYRRLKQRLRIRPDASFGHPPAQDYDHIIYNPPSSAPSTYQTPTKFLPPNDARRKLRSDSDLGVSSSVGNLPLVFKRPSAKRDLLMAKDIEEIRRLRLQDPMVWSRGKLAKRFGCSPLFVGMVCEASPEKKAIQKQVLEAVKSRWGVKRTIAREDRELRKESPIRKTGQSERAKFHFVISAPFNDDFSPIITEVCKVNSIVVLLFSLSLRAHVCVPPYSMSRKCDSNHESEGAAAHFG